VLHKWSLDLLADEIWHSRAAAPIARAGVPS
jgi:hypothetical protein